MTSNPCFVNIKEAKNNFSKLLARAHAGEEIVICKAGKPYVKQVAIDQPEQRELGFLSDLFTEEEELEAIDRALFEPMSEEELALWYGVPAREMLHLADREAEDEGAKHESAIGHPCPDLGMDQSPAPVSPGGFLIVRQAHHDRCEQRQRLGVGHQTLQWENARNGPDFSTNRLSPGSTWRDSVTHQPQPRPNGCVAPYDSQRPF